MVNKMLLIRLLSSHGALAAKPVQRGQEPPCHFSVARSEGSSTNPKLRAMKVGNYRQSPKDKVKFFAKRERSRESRYLTQQKKMATYCSFNGQILRQEEASLQLTDLAVLRGYGIFDYFLFTAGRPQLENQYLDRFYASAQQLHLEVPLARADMSSHLRELIAANQAERGAIRLVLTGGYSPDGYAPGDPNLIVLLHPYPQLPAHYFSEGAGLITHPHQREWPEIKSINYLTGIKLLPQIRAAGALEVLYHADGKLLESVRSNIFLVNAQGELVTPASGILYGITRRAVLDLAQGLLPIFEREVRLEELFQAREAFITGTNKSVMPVTQVDGRPIGDGKVGPWAQRLRPMLEAYREAH
jgi:branched-subunit amino acid aminotransferase/4-amino-4-deoxychorismate lyase